MAIQEETKLASIIDLQKHPIDENHYREKCKTKLDKSGVLVLDNFLFESSVKSILAEAKAQENLAYYCVNEHNVYLDPFDKELSKSHPRNKTVSSSKGCITDDQVPEKSSLRVLYNSPKFKDFLCVVLGETVLYKYDDNLSSINIHYAKEGQELGWHFDNSSFAITLLIQKPEAGGQFEYIRQFRNSDNNDNNYDGVLDLLNGSCNPEKLLMENGTLVLFRGKDAIHRVTPTIGNRTRILSVLAYNSKPDVSLSESARMTFFGKLY
jgi:hypothetical protein